MEKKIDYRFKLLYCFGMMFVVSAHCYVMCKPLTFNETFPFAGTSLALFIFASGYFYSTRAEDDPEKFIIKKLKTLILPMLIYNVVYGIFTQILGLYGFEYGMGLSFSSLVIYPFIDGHQFLLMLGGWFVTPLFVTQVLTMLVRKLFKTILKPLPEWGYFLLALIAGIAGNQLAIFGFVDGAWQLLVRVAYFIVFYSLGIFYKSTIEKYESRIPTVLIMVVAFVIRWSLNKAYGRALFYTPSWCDDYIDGPVMPIIVGVLGIAFWLSVAKLLSPLIGKSRLVNLIADDSYSIMMNQFTGFLIVKGLFYFLSQKIVKWPEFDLATLKEDIWYYYNPPHHLNILYIIMAFAFSIGVQSIINLIKKR